MKKDLVFVILLTMLVLTGCAAKKEVQAGVRRVEIKQEDVEETIPHPRVFTEGFFFHDGVLYESSGLTGESLMMRYSDDGSVGYQKAFNDVFLEGSVIFEDNLYLLTYQDHTAYVLDMESFAVREEYAYDREGWGLTTDGESLIASDGSDCLYFMDTACRLKRSVKVREDDEPVTSINELEYIDGHIFANIWQTNDIVCIDPETGEVEARYMIQLESKSDEKDVLNGIAWDGSSVYLTGKYFDEIWRIDGEAFLIWNDSAKNAKHSERAG